MRRTLLVFVSLFFIWMSATGCAPQKKSDLTVVATTTIVGDVVRRVGGDRIQLVVLLPVGADPHTYEPRPNDAAAIQDASVIFMNGLELEHSLEPVITANATGKVITVSDGIDVLPFSAQAGGESHTAGDPHVWMDPNNVMVWVTNIEKALSEIDPQGADIYRSNADAYMKQLSTLDTWIKTEVNGIPLDERKLITDHQSLGYFARRYGFELAGLIIPSVSTDASVSAADLATVEKEIKQSGIKTIFVEKNSNEAVAAQIASDTGITYAAIYTGSLGDEKSGAATYLDFMRYDVATIIEGLK